MTPGQAEKPQIARYRGAQKLVSLDEMDPTIPAARRALAFRSALFTERGGAERQSVLRKSSIDIVSCLTAMVEDHLTRAMNGEEINLSALNSLINSRRREAELIGIDPAPIDVTTTLTEYLKEAK